MWKVSEMAGGRRSTPEDMLGQIESLEELLGQREDVVTLLDRSAVLRAASHRIQAETGMDLGFASHLEGPDLLVIRGWAGVRGPFLRNLEVPRGLGLGGKSFALARPVWVPDYCSSATITHDFDAVIRSEQIGAMAAVPLVHADEVLGVAYVAQREATAIGDRSVRRLQEIAEPTARALHLAERVRSETAAAVGTERRRIAVALHDSVGAMLFTIGAQLRDLRGDAVATPGLAQKLQTLERRIAETAACFRESLAVLDGVGPQQALTATLRGDCEAFSARTGANARCVALTEIPHLTDSCRGALVALVREALVNVEKHAQASSVVVSLVGTDEGVTVAVADDGLGWAEAAERTLAAPASSHHAGVGASSTGMGLQASYDRLAQLGGSLSVVGNEDGGLTLRAWVPVQ